MVGQGRVVRQLVDELPPLRLFRAELETRRPRGAGRIRRCARASGGCQLHAGAEGHAGAVGRGGGYGSLDASLVTSWRTAAAAAQLKEQSGAAEGPGYGCYS